MNMKSRCTTITPQERCSPPKPIAAAVCRPRMRRELAFPLSHDKSRKNPVSGVSKSIVHHNLDGPFVSRDMPNRGPNRTCTGPITI